VAHRLSTIRSADRILVIEKGRVIEDGDYDTLMAKPAGAFRALAQRQLA
jgi:ATP-binding cassette subfamily B protein